MTWTPMSWPTRRAAAAPASVAALTDPTSPRTMAVTRPASTFCQPTNTTFAVLTIASAASIMPMRPRVSTMPSASPISTLLLSAMKETLNAEPAKLAERLYLKNLCVLCGLRVLRDPSPRRHRQGVNNAFAFDEPHFVDEIRHDARVVRQHADAIAGLERGRAAHAHCRMLFRQPFDRQRTVDRAVLGQHRTVARRLGNSPRLVVR